MSDSAFACYIEAHEYTGEASLIVDEKALVCDTPFASYSISYVDIMKFTMANYMVLIQSDKFMWRISRLGIEDDWFFRELKIAFDRYVRKALMVEEQPRMISEGSCIYQGITSPASIEVFSDCLCILPASRSARRVPYRFINSVEQIEFAIRIRLVTDEFYVLTMLGRDLEPLHQLIIRLLKDINRDNAKFISSLDRSLSDTRNFDRATQLKEGLATVLRNLPADVVQVLHEKLNNSKISEYYEALKSLADADRMAIGIQTLPMYEFELLKQQVVDELAANGAADNELTVKQEDALRWIIWLVTPAKDDSKAVVEFCFPNQDAATYIFRIEGSYEEFLMRINRGLEATNLGREVFSLSDQQLQSSEFAETRVLVDRTPSLQMLRRQYLGRVIHRSLANWQKNIEAHFHIITR